MSLIDHRTTIAHIALHTMPRPEDRRVDTNCSGLAQHLQGLFSDPARLPAVPPCAVSGPAEPLPPFKHLCGRFTLSDLGMKTFPPTWASRCLRGAVIQMFHNVWNICTYALTKSPQEIMQARILVANKINNLEVNQRALPMCSGDCWLRAQEARLQACIKRLASQKPVAAYCQPGGFCPWQ